jgi:ubiquitin-like protein Pup
MMKWYIKMEGKMGQERIRTHQEKRTDSRTAEAATNAGAAALHGAGTESGEKIKAELDELLDSIDDVLETNAEEFVKNYIQKGGE